MRKRAFLWLAGFLLFFNVSHAAEKFSYSVTPSFGIITGDVYEYVYYGNYSDDILSRLDWKQPVIPAGKIDFTFSFNKFFLGGKILAGIPMEGGILEDRDWENFFAPDVLTKFSSHDLRLEKHFDVAAEFGYKSKIFNMGLFTSGGMIYRNQEWTGSNGYATYAKIPKGDVISYEQSLLMPFLAIGMDYQISKSWQFGLGTKLLPYLIIDAGDKHLLRDTLFYDMMRGGLGVSTNVSIQYKKIILYFEYENFFVKRGYTRKGSISKDFRDMERGGGTPGTSDSIFTIMLGYKID